MWAGVAAAVRSASAAGALLTWTAASLSFRAQELLGGTLSIVAVGFVTWMVFWMKRTARGLKGELEGKVQSALGAGGTALAVVAFLSVAREGLETALFLWAAAQSAGNGARPLVGAALGLAVSVALAYALYARTVKIDLGRFFTVHRRLLVVVAAGVLSYGVHDLQEAGVLPGLNTLAFDVSSQSSRAAGTPPAQGHPELQPGDHVARGARLAGLRRSGVRRLLPPPAPRRAARCPPEPVEPAAA